MLPVIRSSGRGQRELAVLLTRVFGEQGRPHTCVSWLEVPRSQPEYRSCGMWAPRTGSGQCRKARISFRKFRNDWSVPRRPAQSEASRFIQSGAGSGVETTRPCAVPRRSCSGGRLVLSSITVCGVVFIPRYPSAEPPTPCPRPRSFVSGLQ